MGATALALTTLGGVGTHDVFGRAAFAPGEPPAAAGADQRPGVDPAAAIEAFGVLDANVREWGLGKSLHVPPAAATSPAACVEIRLEGRVIGRGIAEGAAALVRAHDEAMRSADPKLQLPPDALRQQNAKLAAERMLLSIELAGTLVPFEPKTTAQIDKALSPGLDGLAVRIGDRVGLVFPAEMLGDDMTPGAALGLAVARAGDATISVLDPAALRKDHGAVIYRFGVQHLAQTAVGAAPTFLYRGGKVVAAGSMRKPELEAMATGMARHLAREVLGTLSLQGGIAVSPGVAPGVDAWPAFTKAIVARALAGYAQVAPEGSERLAARYAARALCEQLGTMTPAGPEDAASFVNAKAELQRALGEKPTAESLREAALFGNRGFSFRARELAGQASAGWIALAEAEVGAVSPARNDQAAALVDAVFARSKPEDLAAQMPFLGEAAVRVAHNRKGFTPGEAGVTTHVDELRMMREKVIGQKWDDAGQPDLLGGCVFSPLLYPTWHTARPSAFMGQMLGDDAMTREAERIPALLALLEQARFLRQLCVDENSAWIYTDAGKAIGGVRLAVWDQRQTPEASAIGLMASVELLKSIELLEAKGAGKK